jgi:hypothetical protein
VSISAILLIYVTPLIFLLRKSISTIPIGIKYLSNNFIRSIPLILLTLLTTIILPLLFKYIPYTDTNISIHPPLSTVVFIALIGFIKNLISWYINLIIFITAGKMLIKDMSLYETNQ